MAWAIANTLVAGELRIVEADAPPATLRLDWLGRSHERNPGPLLTPWLEAVLTRAHDGGFALEFHFEGLEFFNSATVTVLIHLIRKARERGITLLITFNRTKKWQALSFDALKCFERADGLVQIRAAD